MKVTTHEAKTRLSELLSRVNEGEEVIICRGQIPVARLVAIRTTPELGRPTVGTVTSGPVGWSQETFLPLSNEELESWGV